MYELNLPQYSFKLKKENDKAFIFDEYRKKYIALTPEEWVRQNLLKYLKEEKKYPAGLIAVEKGLKVNQMQKRTDAVIYNRDRQAIMIIECKAPEVSINQTVFEQIARYNMSLNVDYLLVSNGISHYCCKINYKTHSYEFLQGIPDYSLISS